MHMALNIVLSLKSFLNRMPHMGWQQEWKNRQINLPWKGSTQGRRLSLHSFPMELTWSSQQSLALLQPRDRWHYACEILSSQQVGVHTQGETQDTERDSNSRWIFSDIVSYRYPAGVRLLLQTPNVTWCTNFAGRLPGGGQAIVASSHKFHRKRLERKWCRKWLLSFDVCWALKG